MNRSFRNNVALRDLIAETAQEIKSPALSPKDRSVQIETRKAILRASARLNKLKP
jgi:hypothetical protein